VWSVCGSEENVQLISALLILKINILQIKLRSDNLTAHIGPLKDTFRLLWFPSDDFIFYRRLKNTCTDKKNNLIVSE
jgi:hypothetical protein